MIDTFFNVSSTPLMEKLILYYEEKSSLLHTMATKILLRFYEYHFYPIDVLNLIFKNSAK